MDGPGVQASIRVLGMGNVLMGDDGFGPLVARILQARYDFPDEVEVHDVGTPGLDLTPYICHARAVIVIDTVHGDGPPGSIRVLGLADLMKAAPPPRTSPHQPGLREALMAAELTDATPEELLIVGVVPSTTDTRTALSDQIAASVEPVVERVVRELERLGARVRRREPPDEPDLWWLTEPPAPTEPPNGGHDAS